MVKERRFKEAVDADWQKSRQYGVTGVPTFVSGKHVVVGAQPYDVLEELVSTAGAVRRPQLTRQTSGGEEYIRER